MLYIAFHWDLSVLRFYRDELRLRSRDALSLNHVVYRKILQLATEFRSEKIPRNRLGIDSVIPQKKVLIPRVFRIPRKSPFRSSERIPFFRGKKCSFRRNSEFRGRAHSETRNGTEFRGKIVFRNSQKVIRSFYSRQWNVS